MSLKHSERSSRELAVKMVDETGMYLRVKRLSHFEAKRTHSTCLPSIYHGVR